MTRLVFILVMAGLLFPGSPGRTHEVQDLAIMRIADGERLSLSEIVEDLEGVQMVFVGEMHNSALHHEMQLEVIRVLARRGARVAVGLEMFRHRSQADLDRWISGDLTEREFMRIYYDNWSTDWHLYRDIFLYARKERLPMIGLNLSSEITRQVGNEGFASLTPEQTGELAGVTCEVNQSYMDFIRRAFGMHGHEGKEFTHFCEAQMLWDAAMALRLTAFSAKHPESAIVVLAGNGHAWKHGIPAQVRKRSDFAYRVILPEIPGRADRGKVTTEDADYLWLTR
jgi:uncharacterized iron-regulated protein